MLLSIIRHGQAQAQSNTGRDRDRTLTQLGHTQAQAVGQYLSKLQSPPTHIFASPYIRAQQTALDICASLNLIPTTDNRLGADQGLTEMHALIEEHQDKHSIAIVSHMPTVGQLESLLTNGPASSGTSLWTGQVITLEIPDGELIANATVIDRYRLES
ncbi:MAG: histidine phosphatase family protein [Phycisphaerales bacterium]|nr:histidine phosphatase family protein [Phycisphaerales bacterium]